MCCACIEVHFSPLPRNTYPLWKLPGGRNSPRVQRRCLWVNARYRLEKYSNARGCCCYCTQRNARDPFHETLSRPALQLFYLHARSSHLCGWPRIWGINERVGAARFVSIPVACLQLSGQYNRVSILLLDAILQLKWFEFLFKNNKGILCKGIEYFGF